MNGMYAADASTSTTARINASVSMAGSLRGLPDRALQGSIQSRGEERGEALLEQARVVAVLGLAAGDQLHRVGRRQGVGERAEHEVNAPYQLLARDRKSTRLNSSHRTISYAVFCLKKKKKKRKRKRSEVTELRLATTGRDRQGTAGAGQPRLQPHRDRQTGRQGQRERRQGPRPDTA